ncbi:MAG TPA: histidinol-phosphate transaminase [Methanomassiliicoccaceae archaeon]|jgi:histidinol-phosphate aminotransferase|nr:histidinol-phosphate transaminase [Methanomassiliicoccaceae archaeon]HQD87284.1 histidinol-phosphate transaminase [Methanomassiliicoccaceae archaeon]
MMKAEWIRATVRDIPLYYNPKVKAVRMDTSTNVLGPNPVLRSVLNDCADMDLNQYPKPYSDGLREALAEFYGLKADNFVVGNGSDEVLDIIFKTFMEAGETVVAPYPSYSLHGFFVKINGGCFMTVDLSDGFRLDPDALLKAKGKIIILCTPNNPTANSFNERDVERVVREHDGPVIVDEAYGEFADRSFMPLVDDYENLIVTRTFSKAYGMAGLRVGYMASNLAMAEQMQKIKIPYSLNRVSERAAIAALQNREYVERTVDLVRREREKLSKGLEALGMRPYPSQSNFVLFRCPVPSSEIVSRLADKGVLIRDFGRQRMLEDCARTTVGTEELNMMLLSKLKEVMEAW